MNAKMNADDKRDMPRADELIPRMKPTWGDDQPGNEGKIKVTWLGHAAALAEMPLDSAYTAGGVSGDAASTHTDTTKAGTVEKGQDGKQRGVTVLFDPVFSRRCSPTQMFGSIRYQRTCLSIFFSSQYSGACYTDVQPLPLRYLSCPRWISSCVPPPSSWKQRSRRGRS